TRFSRDWSSDVCSSDLLKVISLRRSSAGGGVAMFAKGVRLWAMSPSNRESCGGLPVMGWYCMNLSLAANHADTQTFDDQFLMFQIGRASCRERVEISVY